MNHYLYLIAWAAFSESSGFVDTKVNTQEDLLPQYLAGNEHVFAVKINVALNERYSVEDIATKYGDSAAFHANYTAWDSTSICICVPADFVYSGEYKEVFAP